jgi:8-oxo-dGTP pyrophosphatase MutT (NUDIX family)
MGGAWVFPGGSVDRNEGEGQPALRAAALRELDEEAGIQLNDPDQLIPFSRWITPAAVKIRFDTWFYLTPVPEGATLKIDGHEIVDARWYHPSEALQASDRGELLLVFPTIKHLERIAPFESAQALMDYARDSEVTPVQPRLVMEGETARLLLPGEPGYE